MTAGLLPVLSLLAFAAPQLFAEETALPQRTLRREVFRDERGDHQYVVSVPPGYSTQRRWPVLLFLHGAGERGNDGELQLSVGLGPMLYENPEFPFVVVFPQCEETEGRYLTGWLADSPDGRRALAILHEVEQNYAVDPQHRVLCGWSMGGYGAWSLAADHPEMWSSVLALAGGGLSGIDVARLAELKVPVWAIHGSNDSLVPVSRSREMVEMLGQQGGRVHFTELGNIDHDVWRPVFIHPDVTRWLLDPDSIDPDKVEWDEAIVEANTRLGSRIPFAPQAAIRRGIGIRLGNEALATLSEGVPAAIPPQSLQGTLSEISRTVGTGADQVTLNMTGGKYACTVTGCEIRAVSGGWVHVGFDLSPIELSFEQTRLEGRPITAQTGPFRVVLGHRHPVRLALDLRPEIRDGKINLVPLRQEFELTSDNWYVTRPDEILVSSGKYTPDNIATGIVGGLYLNREAIVAQVSGVVPGLLETTEQRLNEFDGSRLVTQFLWPLPFLAPRMKLQPCELRTDADGVSLLLDVLVAHHALNSDEPAREQPVTQIDLQKLVNSGEASDQGVQRHSKNICLLTNLDVVRALSDSVVQETRVFVNVLDVPVEKVSRLGDPRTLHPLFPDLPNHPDGIRVNIALVKAFEIQVASATVDEADLKISTSGLRLSIQEFDGSVETWLPVAEIDYRLEQGVSIREFEMSPGTGGIQIRWKNDLQLIPVSAVVNGENGFAQSAVGKLSDHDQERIVNSLTGLLQEGWQAWIETLPSQTTEIPSLTLGDSRLVWLGLGWERSAPDQQQVPDSLRISFGAPTATIRNQSDEAIIFEVKGSVDPWSGPYFLPAGSELQYRAGYTLKWRTLKQTGRIHEIPIGGSLTVEDDGQVRVQTVE